MNRQNIIILSIIAIGSVSSIAYATSTVISDSGITTPSLTAATVDVTGTCTGCGSIEKSYSTWTLQYNETYGSNIGNSGPTYMTIDNYGYVYAANSIVQLYLFNPSGNIISSVANDFSNIGAASALVQSETGFYRAAFDTNNGTIYLYKNNTISFTVNGGACNGCNGFNVFRNSGLIAISPNGEYFAIAGEAGSSSGTSRIILYKAS